MLKFCFLFTFLMTSLISAPAPNQAPPPSKQNQEWEKEVKALDKEIDDLYTQINKYRARADQQEDLAQRLQFQGEVKDEARLAYKQVEKLYKKIAELYQEIEVLEKKKEEILKAHSSPHKN